MAQQEKILNDLEVDGQLAIDADFYLGLAATAASTKHIIAQGSSTNIGIDIDTKGTGLVRVPSNYEIAVAAAGDGRALINKAYHDAFITTQAVDANVSTPTSGEDQYAIVWDDASTTYKLKAVAVGLSFTDGLTLAGSTVHLGGNVTQTTTDVALQNAGDIYIRSAWGTNPAGFNAKGYALDNNQATFYAGLVSIEAHNDSLTVTANVNDAMKYAADYSGVFSTRSLPDIGWTSSHLGTKSLSTIAKTPTGTQDGWFTYWNNSTGKYDLRAITTTGGSSTFIGLTDVPASYSGQSLKAVRVNSGETGLEFYTATGGSSSFITLTDAPASYSGAALQLVRVNAGETGVEFFTAPYLTTISGIAAGGDLSGTYPNPTVAKFNGQLPSYYLLTTNITEGTNLYYTAARFNTAFAAKSTSDLSEGSNLYFTTARVLATALSGLSITGGSISSTDTVLQAFGKLQNQVNGVLGGAIYQGTWNANTNSPTLTSSTGTKGYYYVVSVAGSTNLDGITDWKVGDWAIFNGTTWDKVDNTDAISSFNSSLGAITYTPAGTSNRITVSGASGLTPTFDIAATYVGQTSITTLGTIGTGVWQGTSISTTYTDAKVVSVSGTTNRITSTGGGTPVIDISASYVGQASITTIGTVTTGTLSTGAIIAGVTMTLGSDASYDTYYRNSSGVLTRLANGSTGQVYVATTSNAPSWSTLSGIAVTSITGTVNQITASASTGAVTLSLPSSVIFPGTWAIGTLGYSDTGILWSAQSSTNSYNQVIIQNSSSGASASTNYIVSNDSGSSSTKYGEFGMNSSGFTGSGSFNTANAVYLDAISDDLVIGTIANKTLHFVTNNSTTDNLSITGAGLFTYTVPVNGSIYTSTWTATANTQNAFEYTGTITSRNTASDTLNYLVIDPTLARNAGNPATQIASAVTINPTFSNTFATQYISRFQNAASDRVTIGFDGATTITSGNSSTNPTLTLIGIGTGTNNTLRTFQSDGTTETFSLKDNGNALFTASASTGTPGVGFQFNPGAHTALTASTEVVNFRVQTVNQQWNTGALTTQRSIYFRSPTYRFVGASTLTNAYNVYIDPPVTGTNATFTNTYALGTNGDLDVTGQVHVSNTFSGTGLTISCSNSSGDALYSAGGGSYRHKFATGGTVRLTMDDNTSAFVHQVTITRATNATTTVLTVNQPTNITAYTVETNTILVNNGSPLFSGTIATQRHVWIKGPVLQGGTLTDAYGLYVDPYTVSSGTITNSWALGVNGHMKILDGFNIATGTTTGTKIGTATTQKIGFFNATPVVQESGSNDVLASLVTLGLRAASSNPPLNLGTGAVTCGTLALQDNMTISDAKNIVINTTTGTKIGTGTTQKIGFWNATPVIQPALTGVTTSGFTANTSSNILYAESTFTGNTGSTAYTVSDIIKNLKNAGILAA